jgi:hypothetical protein
MSRSKFIPVVTEGAVSSRRMDDLLAPIGGWAPVITGFRSAPTGGVGRWLATQTGKGLCA